MDKSSVNDASAVIESNSGPSWVKLLPRVLRKRIEHRNHLQKILTNSGWLFVDRMVRLGLGLLISVWIARYLGPAQFGLFSYAIALVTLVGVVASLGLNGIVVRDLVKDQGNINITMGTSFSLQLAGGLIAFSLVIIVVSFVRPDDSLAKLIVVILGFTLVFKATEVVKYWFESKVESKYIVWTENAIFFVSAIVKIWLILAEASILAFVWVSFVEAVLASILLLTLYSKVVGNLSQWYFSLSRAKKLLIESWPLVLVGTASMINMRMDQVILGTMVSNTEVGNYAAAVRIAEVWLVIPGVVGPSIFPSLILAKEKNFELYRHRIRRITKLMAFSVLPVGLIISFFADEIVSMVYGSQYASAGKILKIYIWTGVPYLIFFVLNQMLYIEGLIKIAFWVSIFAVLSNVFFNFILIPIFGGTGAAFSSLITSYGSTLLALLILNLKTRIFWNKSS